MRITNTSTKGWKRYLHPREGTLEVKPLARGSAGDVNFNMTLTRYGGGDEPFETPRHRHTFEQVRFPLKGDLNYGPDEEIPEGWVSYFPAGAFYGPQRVESGTILLLQFGRDYLTNSQYKEAAARLEERGEFHDGMYSSIDPETAKRHNQDAVDAVWVEALGRPMRFPRPRYPVPLLMDPDAFEYRSYDADRGVETKQLGVFTEREVTLTMVRWPRRGTYGLDPGRTQLVFSTADGLLVGDQDEPYPAWTSVWCEQDEELALGGTPTAEALVVELPR